MKLICYLMFFLFFGITSCTSTSTSKKELKYENGTIDVINLKLYQKENIIRLSEIADSIHYISLETSDSCLIGAIDKILRTDNSDIIVVDKDVASSIFVFNDEGRFKCRIGTRGLGMAEYIKIEDVTYGYGFIYVWDSVQKKVLKYSENGDFLDSYKFDYTAYSLCCINENLLSFCCDYTPNYSLYKDKKYPSVIYFNTAENEIAGYLYFNEDVNNLAYTSTLNNLYDKNLYLPLNDTIYRLDADLISAKCILKYDDKYLLYKNEYIERSYTERMTVNDAEEACNKGKFPQLITYFSCDSVHLLFMRMNGFLYSGFYYPDTKEYKEASSLGKIPIENDIDKSFLFSPRCVEGNKVYCVIEPSEIPENNNLPINVGIDDNPVLAEIYMKYGNKK